MRDPAAKGDALSPSTHQCSAGPLLVIPNAHPDNTQNRRELSRNRRFSRANIAAPAVPVPVALVLAEYVHLLKCFYCCLVDMCYTDGRGAVTRPHAVRIATCRASLLRTKAVRTEPIVSRDEDVLAQRTSCKKHSVRTECWTGGQSQPVSTGTQLVYSCAYSLSRRLSVPLCSPYDPSQESVLAQSKGCLGSSVNPQRKPVFRQKVSWRRHRRGCLGSTVSSGGSVSTAGLFPCLLALQSPLL